MEIGRITETEKNVRMVVRQIDAKDYYSNVKWEVGFRQWNGGPWVYLTGQDSRELIEWATKLMWKTNVTISMEKS